MPSRARIVPSAPITTRSMDGSTAAMRSPQTATYLCRSIGNVHDRGRSLRALRAIGAPAEKAAAAALTDGEKHNRLQAAHFVRADLLKSHAFGAPLVGQPVLIAFD